MEVWIDEGMARAGEMTLWFYELDTRGHTFFFNFWINERLKLPALFRRLGVSKVTLSSALQSSTLAMLTYLSDEFTTVVRTQP